MPVCVDFMSSRFNFFVHCGCLFASARLLIFKTNTKSFKILVFKSKYDCCIPCACRRLVSERIMRMKNREMIRLTKEERIQSLIIKFSDFHVLGHLKELLKGKKFLQLRLLQNIHLFSGFD